MRAALVLATAVCLLPLAVGGAAIPEPGARPPVPKAVADPVEPHLKAGRELFSKRQFAAAFEKFSLALALKPNHREARFLAGLAAYWARRPEQALDFWNALLDTAPRNSAEEWKLELQRVMALTAVGQNEAAEEVVARLYELRQKLPEAKRGQGFIREHFLVGGFRIGCWEVFDEKHESQELWSFPVTALDAQDESTVARFVALPAALPGGGPGFVFAEETPSDMWVYKRWIKRPDYAEVHAVLLDVVQGKVTPVEKNKADNAEGFPRAPAGVVLPWRQPPTVAAGQAAPPAATPDATPPAAPGTPRPPAARERASTEAELALAAKVKALGLDPAAAHILTVASRLRDVELDVTRLTRLSLVDALLAERYLAELNAKAPFAQEDAAELVDLVSKAKAEHVREACAKLSRIGARQPYLDYAFLTALNTRGRDVPSSLLKELLKSRDFMVRQTAALLLGRAGDQRGLTQLFKDVENTDALGSSILQGSIEELVGPVLGAPPAARSAAAGAGLDDEQTLAFQAWQQKAAQWWKDNGGKLKFAAGQWSFVIGH